MENLFYIKKFIRDDGEQLAMDGEEILLSEDNDFMAPAEIATTAVEYTEADGAERVQQRNTTSEQEINGLIVPKNAAYWTLAQRIMGFFQINHDYKIVYKEKNGGLFSTAWGWISKNVQVSPKPHEDYATWNLAITIGSPLRSEYSEDGSGKEQFSHNVVVNLITDNLGGEMWEKPKELPKTIQELEYLQDFAHLPDETIMAIVESMTEETPYTLKDKRDNKDYKIAKLKDGTVIMDNLRLVGKTISSADSDMTSGTFEVPNEEASAFKVANTEVEAKHAYLDAEHGEEYGAHYTWFCATAGSGDKSLTGSDQKAPDSIAPKGWRLMSSEDIASIKEAYSVSNNADGATKMKAAPLNFKLGAYVRYTDGNVASSYWGTEGLWWLPTAATGATQASCFNIQTSRVFEKTEQRVYGFSVRCVLRQRGGS